MTIRYKLTDAQGRTYGGTQWGPGVTHTAPGTGELCGPGWIHVYASPLLAELLNPIGANYKPHLLWECSVQGRSKTDHGLKEGWERVTTERQIPLPTISGGQRVRFALECALSVCKSPSFVRWASSWLRGENRSAATAWSMSKSASVWGRVGATEAWAASWAAAAAAAYAAPAVRASEAEEAEEAAACAAAEAIRKTAIISSGKEGFSLVALAEQACA